MAKNQKKKKKQPPRPPKKRTGLFVGAGIALALVVLAAVLLLRPRKTQYAVITVKDFGVISVELDRKNAPKTVENFVKLAESGFYDGLTFHRNKADLFVQGGDPNGNGTGGPKETVVGEFAANGIRNQHKHVRGTLSMARAQDYNSGGSQFFIVCRDFLGWDGQYAAFGSVVEGIEVVDALSRAGTQMDQNGLLAPETQPVIEQIRIVDSLG